MIYSDIYRAMQRKHNDRLHDQRNNGTSKDELIECFKLTSNDIQILNSY